MEYDREFQRAREPYTRIWRAILTGLGYPGVRTLDSTILSREERRDRLAGLGCAYDAEPVGNGSLAEWVGGPWRVTQIEADFVPMRGDEGIFVGRGEAIIADRGELLGVDHGDEYQVTSLSDVRRLLAERSR